jgi:hypothetical protein
VSYRVLRLLEYTFPDAECADRNMQNWAIPANGVTAYGDNIIRSSIIQYPEKDEHPHPLANLHDIGDESRG